MEPQEGLSCSLQVWSCPQGVDSGSLMTLAFAGVDAGQGLGCTVCLGIDADDPLQNYASSLTEVFAPLRVRPREGTKAKLLLRIPLKCSRRGCHHKNCQDHSSGCQCLRRCILRCSLWRSLHHEGSMEHLYAGCGGS